MTEAKAVGVPSHFLQGLGLWSLSKEVHTPLDILSSRCSLQWWPRHLWKWKWTRTPEKTISFTSSQPSPVSHTLLPLIPFKSGGLCFWSWGELIWSHSVLNLITPRQKMSVLSLHTEPGKINHATSKDARGPRCRGRDGLWGTTLMFYFPFQFWRLFWCVWGR